LDLLQDAAVALLYGNYIHAIDFLDPNEQQQVRIFENFMGSIVTLEINYETV